MSDIIFTVAIHVCSYVHNYVYWSTKCVNFILIEISQLEVV